MTAGAWAVALSAVAVGGCLLLVLPPPVAGRARAVPAPDGDAGVDDVALVCDLAAAALRSGAPLPLALRELAEVVGRGGAAAGSPGALDALAAAVETGDEVRLAAGEVGELAAVAEAVEFSARTGAPVAAMLAEAARTVRRRRRDAATRAAGRLGTALVLPLGLAALPGFLLLGVAPVVVRLLTSLA